MRQVCSFEARGEGSHRTMPTDGIVGESEHT
jgi:hypothetical protein